MSLSIRIRSRMPRVEAILLAAMIIFIGGLVTRLARDYQRAALQTGPPPAPVALSSADNIMRLQALLRQNSDNTYAYAQLGLALLQRVRESGDASLYPRAEKAFEEALKRDPAQVDALIGQGLLALGRHDFQGAILWAERARSINPYRAEILGVLVDAQIELGRYEEAAVTLQTMVDMRPGLAAYSRTSYLRELHGDSDGARAAMQAALDASVPGSEAWLWTQVQLGHLYFHNGNWPQAELAYEQALAMRPDYVYAIGGMARLKAARGEYAAAIESYLLAAERIPLPEFLVPLGELYEITGQLEEAHRQYDLVRVIQQLNASAGVDVDLELALFEADHGSDPAQALAHARAVYARRPGIYGADVLAWTLYRNNEISGAWEYAQQALHLGTRDALLHFHAGRIAYALGELQPARYHLEQALAINPAFSVRYAPEARELLAELDGGPQDARDRDP